MSSTSIRRRVSGVCRLRPSAVFALGLLALGIGCRPASTTGKGPLSALLEPCQLSAPGHSERVQAKCGTLEVFEDRLAAKGRKISLRVAVVEATGSKVAPDPLFVLAGGPGQAASEVFPQAFQIYARFNQQRDIVLIDQRGTGSSGKLHCPELDAEPPSDSPEQSAGLLERCLKTLPGDPRFYTTALAMDDLDDVRAALGYERINLYGVSYGTRAALTYVRRHPKHVRAMVLDAVAPPDWPLGPSIARDAQRALDSEFARCAADPGCHEAFPSLSEDFQALLARMEAHPEPVTVADPVTGELTPVTVNRTLIASTIRMLSYAPETASLIPLLVETAVRTGDPRLIAAQSLMNHSLLNLAQGMHFSIVCAEDIPFLTPDEIAHSGEGTYLGNEALEMYLEACKVWPRGDIPPDTRTAVTSDVPTLLLSGALDPVTPPANAEATARTLSHSLALVVPGGAHGVLLRGCAPRIMEDFLRSGTVDGLDTRCLATIRPMSFFTSFKGSKP